jgi:hypothetical protein
LSQYLGAFLLGQIPTHTGTVPLLALTEYYWAIKKKEFMLFAEKLIILKVIIVSIYIR